VHKRNKIRLWFVGLQGLVSLIGHWVISGQFEPRGGEGKDVFCCGLVCFPMPPHNLISGHKTAHHRHTHNNTATLAANFKFKH
jgi:hypothetical protein